MSVSNTMSHRQWNFWGKQKMLQTPLAPSDLSKHYTCHPLNMSMPLVVSCKYTVLHLTPRALQTDCHCSCENYQHSEIITSVFSTKAKDHQHDWDCQKLHKSLCTKKNRPYQSFNQVSVTKSSARFYSTAHHTFTTWQVQQHTMPWMQPPVSWLY